VAIVGAGLAGLTAAYELSKVGLKPHVYEGSTRLGGRSQRASVLSKHLTAITVRRAPARRLDLQPVHAGDVGAFTGLGKGGIGLP
jgi:monoamine oxidase